MDARCCSADAATTRRALDGLKRIWRPRCRLTFTCRQEPVNQSQRLPLARSSASWAHSARRRTILGTSSSDRSTQLLGIAVNGVTLIS
jgi:hypothetical protein